MAVQTVNRRDRVNLPPWVQATWVIPVLVGVGALVLRLIAVGTSYGAHVDEMFYMDVGTSVRDGHLPPLVRGGAPFLLHPPGFFILEAGWQLLTQPDGDRFQQLYTMRLLNIFLAVITAVLLYRLVLRVAGRTPAIVAAALFAIDPFALRQNGRLLLETSTLMFVVIGYLLLVRLMQGAPRRPAMTAVFAGLAFGCAMVSKDMAITVTLVPLLVLLLVRWKLPRRLTGLAAAVSTVPYLLYLVVVAAHGMFGDLFAAKTVGVRRMVGLAQDTGFNKPGAPALTHELLVQAKAFGVSYLLIALGTLAGLYLLLRARRAEERLLGLFTVSAAATVGYAAAFGTSEEHFLYFLVIPAIPSLCVAAAIRLRATAEAQTVPDSARRPALRTPFATVVAGALVLALAADATAWWQVRTVPDDGQHRAAQWLAANVPQGGTIAYTSTGTSFQYIGTRFVPIALTAPPILVYSHVQYLIVLQREVDLGYTSTDKAALQWFVDRATPVFQFDSRSTGDVVVFRTTDPQAW